MTQGKTKVLVIGDGCKDVFQYGKCERLSPEAPVPVFKPIKATNNGGMAVNVYNNLIALGVDCDIITNSGITKTRYVDEVSNQMLLRIDENDSINQITQEECEKINFNDYAAVVISDYNKGYLDVHDIMWIVDNHPLTFIDTKKELGGWCDDIKFIKINNKEFKANEDYLRNYYNGNLIVTKGKEGAILNHDEVFPIEEEHDVRDLSGAGDTFLAGLVADYIKNNDIRSAIKFANKCSAWVVTQKGVVVVDLNKVRL
jgi:D-beta-D-heptose 7-phosphate kinase/D-beta-D-heptose 1-phosphate adenosyltransferase